MVAKHIDFYNSIDCLKKIKDDVLNSRCDNKDDGLYATYITKLADKRIQELQKVK